MTSSDDDVFYGDEEEDRKKIANMEYEKNLISCYEKGYHGGLISGIEEK